MKTVFSISIFLFIINGVFDDVPDGVKTVIEGDSLTLQTHFIEMQKDGLIEWKFNDTDIATLHKETGKIHYSDFKLIMMFSDRFILDQTGSLTVWNIRIKHSGEYKVKSTSSQGTKYKTFNVIVTESPLKSDEHKDEIKTLSVTEGNPETLHTDIKLQKNDLILWRFGPEGSLIAKCDTEDNSISYYEGADGRFRDRLKMDSETGSLTITDINTKHVGEFRLKIIRDRIIIYKRFAVTVFVPGLSTTFVVVVVLLLTMVVAVAAAAGGIYWHHRNSESQKLKKLMGLLKIRELEQLQKIFKQLEQMPEISKQLSKISEKELRDVKVSGNEMLKISEKLKKMSANYETELLEISEQLEKLRRDEFSEHLLKISEHLKKIHDVENSEQETQERMRSELENSERNEGCIYVQETAISQALQQTCDADRGFNPKTRKSLVIRSESMKRPPTKDIKEEALNEETPLKIVKEDDE